MKNVKNAFSGILVVALLAICSVGLLWLNKGATAASVSAVEYNSVPTLR